VVRWVVALQFPFDLCNRDMDRAGMEVKSLLRMSCNVVRVVAGGCFQLVRMLELEDWICM
jgi:hypothetical protein